MSSNQTDKEVAELLARFEFVSSADRYEAEQAIATWAREWDEQKCMDHSDCNWKGCALVGELQAEVAVTRLELFSFAALVTNLKAELRERDERIRLLSEANVRLSAELRNGTVDSK